MDIITLDLNTISTKEKLYEELALTPHFPPFFGKNLDALYDVLSTANCKLEIDGAYNASDEIKEFLPMLIRVLEDAKSTNPTFTYEILEEPCSEEE